MQAPCSRYSRIERRREDESDERKPRLPELRRKESLCDSNGNGRGDPRYLHQEHDVCSDGHEDAINATHAVDVRCAGQVDCE